MPTSYNIQINEEQRKLILGSLRFHRENSHHPFLSEVREERDLLADMFADLPTVESEEPRLLHGFCL